MTDHTQAVADALAHFGSETRAAGCTVDDITHGLALAREVRRLTAEVEALERRWAELARWNFYEHGLTSVDSNRLADKMKELEAEVRPTMEGANGD